MVRPKAFEPLTYGPGGFARRAVACSEMAQVAFT